MGLMEWWKARQQRACVASARRRLAQGEFNEARLDLEGVEDPEAAELRAQALAGLVRMNLEHGAAFWGSSRDGDANASFDRAQRFGASPEPIEAAKVSRRGPGVPRPRG